MAALLATARPLAAQQIPARWDLSVRGSAMEENGDLRIAGRSGRILLQHDDSAFEPLRDLRITPDSISFTVARHRRFAGTLAGSAMHGTVREDDGSMSQWSALPIPPGSKRWPVAPRVTVRQLAVGTAAKREVIPAAWMSQVADTLLLLHEYRALAASAGVAPLGREELADGSRRLLLGLGARARDAADAVLDRLEHLRGRDDPFRRWFDCGTTRCIDLHDAALGEARHYLLQFSRENAVKAMVALGELVPDADSVAMRESIWRMWEAARADSATFSRRIDSLARHDELSANSLRALLAGYDDAVRRWRGEVTWLLTAPWLDTPQGPRSPAQLMAAFWQVDTLPIPDIVPRHFGEIQAIPIIGAGHLAPFLLHPRNASAREWLDSGGVAEAFAAWRPLRWGEIPLTVSIGGRDEIVISPAAQEEARPAAAIGPADAIAIDPGIMPIAAVATVLHEWNHLLAKQRRLAGPHPPEIVVTPSQVELREADPWLGEGFAEWATDAALAPAGASSALLRLTQAEKRLAIATTHRDDPHSLGYELVSAAAARRDRGETRDMLVRHLDSPQGAAAALHLSGRGKAQPLVLDRPANAAVIPEITFTWDDGAIFDLSRRLVLPKSHLEQ
ncbi:MAG TPA: hypothetical protein VGM20_14515 [Gemmatimonadales bacterium]|jgi:hypothetical protein